MSDRQIEELAEWYWNLRLTGQWWGGKNASIVVRCATARKLRTEGCHLALALLTFLIEKHGGRQNATFAVDPKVLRRGGEFGDGVNQFYAAIGVLVDLNCLQLVRKGSGRRLHHEYRLGPGVQEEGKGERASSYISIQNGDPKDRDVQVAA